MISLGAYEYNGNHSNLLGSGAFAFVYKGRITNKPDEPVAIKIMKKDQNMSKNKTLLSKEISVLKDLKHDHIVRLYDHGVTPNGVYIVMEYCNGGDLSEYLQAKGTLPEDTIRHFLLQIGSAMDAINKKGFMHRDLKPGNILLSHCRDCGQHVTEIPGYLLTFKLADFGFARFLQQGMMAVTMCGSPMYMAPEVLMCHKYDAVADIWSMGIIVYQCLTGKAPFYANNPEALKNIYEKSKCLKPKIPVTTSRLLRDLLLRMLVRNPSDRIDFDNFLNHQFLQQPHFEPSTRSGNLAGARAVTANVPNRSRRDLPSRTDHVAGIGTLGQGAGDGPFYLAGRNSSANRDKTPQRNPTVNKVQPPAHLVGRTAIPSSASPAYLNAPTQLSPGPSLDEVDDEMSRTTVDEYFEDELDSSTLPLETNTHAPTNYAPNAPDLGRGFFHGGYHTNAPPVPCRGSSVSWKTPNPAATQNPMHLGYQRPLPMGLRPSAEHERGENHFEDYVILNPDGSEADRYGHHMPYSNVDHYPRSNVGQIVANPAAYLANHPRLQRTESPPLPDVAAVGAKGDTFAPSYRPGSSVQRGQMPHGTHENTRLAGRPPSYPAAIGRTHVAPTQEPQEGLDALGRYGPRGLAGGVPGAADSGHPQPQPHLRTRDVGQWHQTAEQSNAVRTSKESEQARLPPNRPTSTAQGEPSSVGQAYSLLAASGEFNTAAHPVRSRPYSGGGILEYVANGPNGLLSGGAWAAAEFSDEQLRDSQHNEAIKTITMVLELCELLSELAERRASVLSDCTIAPAPEQNPENSTSTGVNEHTQIEAPMAQSDTASDTSSAADAPTGGLKFLPEAQRIVEQIVLYRRVLYYLEYVFDQVKKSCKDRRLKSTATARRRLTDCNTLYHRCYIRLRQLARQSRRDDLIEPVGRLLANITANRLIFQYALVQCQAAEMDEYVGDVAQSLQRYKAGITLLHGLRQHAKTTSDKTLLADCMRLLHDRINSLLTTAAKAHHEGCFGHSGAFADASSSPTSERSGTPLQNANPMDRSFGESPSGADCALAEASPLTSSPIH